MVQITQGSPHGLFAIQVALVGQDGFAYGSTGPDSAANGDTMGAYLVKYPQNANLPTPARNTINFTGGDRWLGAFQYGISAVGEFTVTTSDADANLIALLSNSVVDQTTNDAWTMYSENELEDVLPQVCILITWRLQARGTNDGGDYYLTTIIPRAWMAPGGPQGAPAFQTGGEYTFTVTPTASSTLPTGLALSTTTMALQDDKAFRVNIITDKPIALVNHLGDSGGSTEFTLPYRPLTTDVDSSSGDNHLVIAGAVEDATSVVTTTGVVTVAVAESAKAGMLHTTAFVPTS